MVEGRSYFPSVPDAPKAVGKPVKAKEQAKVIGLAKRVADGVVAKYGQFMPDRMREEYKSGVDMDHRVRVLDDLTFSIDYRNKYPNESSYDADRVDGYVDLDTNVVNLRSAEPAAVWKRVLDRIGKENKDAYLEPEFGVLHLPSIRNMLRNRQTRERIVRGYEGTIAEETIHLFNSDVITQEDEAFVEVGMNYYVMELSKQLGYAPSPSHQNYAAINAYKKLIGDEDNPGYGEDVHRVFFGSASPEKKAEIMAAFAKSGAVRYLDAGYGLK